MLSEKQSVAWETPCHFHVFVCLIMPIQIGRAYL